MKVECKVCFKKFHNGNILKGHSALVHAYCNICDTQSSAVDILAHLKNIHFLDRKCQACQTKRLKCQDCYFSTRILGFLKKSKPKTPKISKCEMCAVTLPTKSDLNDHKSSFHKKKCLVKIAKLSEKSSLEIICQKCEKISENMTDYRAHFLTHFEDMFRIKKCTKCIKSFGNNNSVRSHIFTNHEKYLPPKIKCQSCKFTTRSSNILKDHCKLENHQLDEKKLMIKSKNLDIEDKENLNEMKIEDTPKNYSINVKKRKSSICEPKKLRF